MLLVGLALVLGSLAGADVHRRERALSAAVGPSTVIVVAVEPLRAGAPISAAQLGRRSVPERYVPADAVIDGTDIVGLRPKIDVSAGDDVTVAMLERTAGPLLRPGERTAEVVAIGDAERVRPGVRVDLLVTSEREGKPGTTRLALEDAEVLASDPAPTDGGEATAGRLAVSLRVTVKQAVYLAAAQNFARELRVLVRSPDDDRRGAAGTTAGAALEAIE